MPADLGRARAQDLLGVGTARGNGGASSIFGRGGVVENQAGRRALADRGEAPAANGAT